MNVRYLKGLILALISAVAGTSLAKAEQAGSAEDTLLSSIFPSGCHFSGEFKQRKTVQGLPVPLNSTGDFYFSCDLGLVWHTASPFSEAILYVNSANNFRAQDDGTLTPLSGVARYVMSNIIVRLLKGETGYFTEEFAITEEAAGSVLLLPENEMMQKGLHAIRITKTAEDTASAVLNITVTDATGQDTNVVIDQVQQYDFEGKRSAYDQCTGLYADKTDWCQVLRSPSRYSAF